jgi:hypothetical protein
MSYLLIREFPELAAAQDPGGQPLAVLEPAILETQVIVSSIPVLFGPFQPTTKWVELCAQTTCSILFGLTSAITTASITTGNGRLNSNDRVVRRIAFSPASQPAANPNQPQANAISVSAVICSSS